MGVGGGWLATLFIPQDPQLILFSVLGLGGIRYIIVSVSVSYIAVAPIAAGGGWEWGLDVLRNIFNPLLPKIK